MPQEPKNPSQSLDERRFVTVADAEDPLSAEALVQALEEANIPVFVRPRRSEPLVENITSAAQPWSELLVPEDVVAQAQTVVDEERRRLEQVAEENARAVEEEAGAPE